MERFQCEYPIYGSVAVDVLDPIPTDNRLDEYREVQLLLQDGQRYRAGCFRDPRERGGHWWEEAGMFIVQDLTTSQIMAAVDEALQGGAIEQAFEPWLED
jgi:hypothetical protein